MHDLCPPVKSPEKNASVSSGETGDMFWLPAELLSENYNFTGQQNLCCIIQVGEIITSKLLGQISAVPRILIRSFPFLLQLGEYIKSERKGHVEKVESLFN